MSQSFVGPSTVTRDTSDNIHQYSLTCFVVGEPGRQWSRLGPEARRNAILDQLARMFNTDEARNVKQVLEQEWIHEEFSRGAPCPVFGKADSLRFNKVLRAPHSMVHFAGTETAHEWKGYMDGAIDSGQRVAKEVKRALDLSSSYSKVAQASL
jgi:monoamine oxidase